jgi:hypothetical protein
LLISSGWDEIFRLNQNQLQKKNKSPVMKFINYLEKVSGVDIMGLTSLLIFFLFFVVMLTWVFKTKKKDFNEVSRIPLDNQH